MSSEEQRLRRNQSSRKSKQKKRDAEKSIVPVVMLIKGKGQRKTVGFL